MHAELKQSRPGQGKMTPTGHPQEPIYRAFISYSHADARFAGWLHRTLEGFRLPVRGPGEGLPALSPIFIDRAELAAASDLSQAVRQAIAQSAALVVVASPAARASQWVAQEIDLFRALNPDLPILAALVEGEPGEAFPEPLLIRDGLAVEPLAADFRPGQDGKRLGLLKLVAGLTGQPLDRLVQRDAQKRQRRVMAITAAAGILILVLATLLVLALRARSEAERQRAEAEGMVEFMLTDLRDKLKGVGRLDVMEAVNQRAMQHYSRQELSSLPDDSLTRRARLLHAMGEDDQRRGDYSAAAGKYREAHRVTAAVRARNPRDPEAVFAHAQSEYWIGAVELSLGQPGKARGPFEGYLREAESLARLESDSSRSSIELAYAHGNLCDLEMGDGAEHKTLPRHCAQSLAEFEEAVRRDPGDRGFKLELANRYGWTAVHHEKLEQYAEALSYRGKEVAQIDKLLELDPRNREYAYRRLTGQFGIGMIEAKSGQPELAFATLLQCRNALARLEQEMPGDHKIRNLHLRSSWWATRAAIDARTRDAGRQLAYLDALFDRTANNLPDNEAADWKKLIQELQGELKNGR